MATFLVYVAEWALTLTLLYSLYGLLLKRETFHDINRGILLLILCLSALLPLCPVETEHASTLSQQLDVIETTIYESVSATPATMSAGSTQATLSLSLWPRVLAWVYIAGAIICMGHYLLSLASLARLITRGDRVQAKGMPRGVRVIYSAGLPVSCSWMCWIMTGSKETARRGNPILEHELAHVRLAHSLDMLLCELTARLLWFLPFGWMLRKDLRDVHEFQADRKVLRSGIEEEGYQHLLIRHAVNQHAPSVANSFAHSTIKKRLVMMCRRPSTRKAALKTIYLLPLVLIAVTAFARPTAVEEIRQTLVKEEEAAPLLSPTALTESVKPTKEEPKDPVEEAVTEQTTQPETPTATEETLAVSLPQVEETIQPAQAPTAPPSPAAPAASKPAASPEAVSRVSFAPHHPRGIPTAGTGFLDRGTGRGDLRDLPAQHTRQRGPHKPQRAGLQAAGHEKRRHLHLPPDNRLRQQASGRHGEKLSERRRDLHPGVPAPKEVGEENPTATPRDAITKGIQTEGGNHRAS